jgi:hypothetical protein
MTSHIKLLWSIWAIDRDDPRTEELLNRLLSWRRLVYVIRKRSSRMKATPRPENIPKRDVYLDCGEYLLRTVNSDDASERWANWMSENLRLVNSASKAMTPQDIVVFRAAAWCSPSPDERYASPISCPRRGGFLVATVQLDAATKSNSST